jgi:hypothetical protein
VAIIKYLEDGARTLNVNASVARAYRTDRSRRHQRGLAQGRDVGVVASATGRSLGKGDKNGGTKGGSTAHLPAPT